MNQRAVCLYMHMHQPYRVRPYSVFDIGQSHNYWFQPERDERSNNEFVLHKVAEKSYRPTLKILGRLLQEHPEFRFSLSITGTLIEQLQMWAPDVITALQALVKTGQVEVVGETYHHSLAFFYSHREFERQVALHTKKIRELFGVTPRVLRNTELSYNNDLAQWAERTGYKGIITEGWEGVLGHRSSNFMYQPVGTKQIKLLLKNYKLSDDIAFRFSDRDWSEWPLTADKYVHWLNAIPNTQPLINLFVDFETFGEHQWEHSGIFDFLAQFPAQFLQTPGNTFMTLSQAIDTFEPVDTVDVPHTITWADTERDLTAWTGNAMQQEALHELYRYEHAILATGNVELIEDWRRLQTSDHAYYMCTKWFNDGDIHAYFSAYDSPYDAFIYFSNALRDIQLRLMHNKEVGTAGWHDQ